MLKKYPTIGLYTNPKVLAVFFLGISSGLPLALVLSTLSIWLAEEGVSKTAIGLFAAITTPYAIKFMWSPLVDQMPIPFLTRFLGRRRGWMVFTQACLAASLIALGLTNPSENAWLTALCAFIVAVSSASQDIVIDAYRVEILEEKQQGAGAAMIVFGYRIGMLISSAGALFIAHYMGWFMAYAAMASLIGIGFLTVMMTGEPQGSKPPKVDLCLILYTIFSHRLFSEPYYYYKKQSRIIVSIINIIIYAVLVALFRQKYGYFTSFISSVFLQFVFLISSYWVHKVFFKGPFEDFTTKEGWKIILLFIVLYKLGDAFAGVMTNPFLVEIGFSKVEIASVVKTFGFIAVMAGAFIGGVLVNKWGMIKSLWVCGILQMLSNLMFLLQAKVGYNIEVLAAVIAIENLSGGMGTTAFVAYISSLCNKRYTATQYALFSSLASVGRTWLSASSGWFVDSIGWINFFILSTVIAVPGLLMLLLLRRFEKKELKKDIAMQKNRTKNCSSA
ncbi:MAG: AmpG family muropeptide MFS transporter [Rickettsiales bacterium]|nr:AmpG family muropeptide MFS transporter [Pseudomonadota bacterium]MDA0966630.1 AmpG family muropeptide MFS transporter [Pseudomonadota bacterium]MDG4543658.1 AmpG family muropeptide MFS transporter [Rickettsiales bacterium]MDG4545805.1 AmpG family muropeptide MFS transporter [Rickettsiales bacterium]MDG4547421.1 AmpG family muropeptide MFS transporter [Rickettsiales bacterium]